MRIVVMQDIAQWIGSIEEQEYLEVPDTMDISQEEGAWFTSGGGTLQNFVAYLIGRGAKKISVEIWTIRYQ